MNHIEAVKRVSSLNLSWANGQTNKPVKEQVIPSSIAQTISSSLTYSANKKGQSVSKSGTQPVS